ncbi:hypothetical protein [Mesorhizobium sp. M1B.F.Ca.ET.045.04.1.1]|uniref:hypothetical protein n=1 Tax=Mesorhizobium sp. M1B.F.Ca.ET.045.04.1.1 TaxID=2493673 RepID=UPI000F760EBA|nr:hypothetical protein [Mesorhizobium sp. M1B.F.Ca.ET.045.04.1.1]AZO29402.1 hypothetical protein EJ071_19745 [Mesorhizobium sp. M1B.F.Ca.ET.045.04.1.1]
MALLTLCAFPCFEIDVFQQEGSSMATSVNFSIMSIAEIDEVIRQAEAAKLVPTGIRAISLITSLKEAIKGIREIDESILGEVLGPIAPQAMPKEATTARKYGLSETQVKNAKDKAIKAIAGL